MTHKIRLLQACLLPLQTWSVPGSNLFLDWAPEEKWVKRQILSWGQVWPDVLSICMSLFSNWVPMSCNSRIWTRHARWNKSQKQPKAPKKNLICSETATWSNNRLLSLQCLLFLCPLWVFSLSSLRNLQRRFYWFINEIKAEHEIALQDKGIISELISFQLLVSMPQFFGIFALTAQKFPTWSASLCGCSWAKFISVAGFFFHCTMSEIAYWQGHAHSTRNWCSKDQGIMQRPKPKLKSEGCRTSQCSDSICFYHKNMHSRLNSLATFRVQSKLIRTWCGFGTSTFTLRLWNKEAHFQKRRSWTTH